MPKKKNSIYQYGEGDDPIGVANQFGITPTQLLQANPGGSPFTTGQQIVIPQFQYSAPIGPQPATLLQQRMAQPVQPAYDVSQRGRGTNANQSLLDMRGRGYGQASPVDQLNAMRGRGYGQTNTLSPETGIWEDPAAPTTPNTANGDFYGYERDPETGRSVRVIKNAASANFLKELRWDPQARRYVSIGRLLRQGKLDLKGNWHKTSKRQKRNAAIERKNQQQQTQKQDLTLANSLISFGASSG